MMRLYLAAAGLLLALALGWVAWHEHGKRAVAEAQVRDYHNQVVANRNRQRRINDALQTQINGLAAVNTRLGADLDRLRNRPLRAGADTRAHCQGVTGAELSGADAAFLVREAARADGLRTALIACYGYADALQGRVSPANMPPTESAKQRVIAGRLVSGPGAWPRPPTHARPASRRAGPCARCPSR